MVNENLGLKTGWAFVSGKAPTWCMRLEYICFMRLRRCNFI